MKISSWSFLASCNPLPPPLNILAQQRFHMVHFVYFWPNIKDRGQFIICCYCCYDIFATPRELNLHLPNCAALALAIALLYLTLNKHDNVHSAAILLSSYPAWFSSRASLRLEPLKNSNNLSSSIAVLTYRRLSSFLPQRYSQTLE